MSQFWYANLTNLSVGGEIYLRFTASEFNHKSPKDEELQVRPPLSVFVEMEEVEEDEDEDSDTVFKGQGEVIPLGK